MLSTGISLIICNDEQKARDMADQLHVHPEDLVPLEELRDNLHRLETAVFYTVTSLSDLKAETLMSVYNVRRGLLLLGDSRKVTGRDLSWMKAVMKPQTTQPKPAPRPTEAYNVPIERDDPYEDLGYRRK